MDKVVHFELPADNVERAKKFYEAVFDWKIKKEEMPGMEYYSVVTGKQDANGRGAEMNAINGGMAKRSDFMKSTTVVANVASVEETIKKAQANGGKLVMPTQKMGDFGLYAKITDAEGNVIGIWQDVKKA